MEVAQQRSLGQVWPIAYVAAAQRADEFTARREVAGRVVPRQRFGPERAQAFGHRRRRGARRYVAQGLVFEHELAEAHRAARDDGFRARVPHDFVGAHELRLEVLE
jgi:hypothetical protein